MLRSVGAIVAGYALMTAIVMLGTLAAAAIVIPSALQSMRGKVQAGEAPHPDPLPASFLMANLGISLVAAVTGGWLTAWIANGTEVYSVIGLTLLVLVLSIVYGMKQRPGQPPWYGRVLAIIAVVGSLAGGLLLGRA